MRYGAQHKAATRARILEAAGRTLRVGGLGGVSVEKVMAAAGLTVGGFYAHFRSKEALIGEALGSALEDSARRWTAGLEEARGFDFVRGLVRRYLNRAHRDGPESGCPLAPALSELARASAATHVAVSGDVEALLARLTPQMVGADEFSRRQNAVAVLALCFGGLSLARAVAGTALSDEVLRASRAFAEAAVRPPGEGRGGGGPTPPKIHS